MPVSVVGCSSYQEDEVTRSIQQSLANLGGIQSFVHPGDHVVIKPNFIGRKSPDEAATTHPSVIEAVVLAVQKAGGTVTIAESPGGPYTPAILKHLYDTCGATAIAEKTGCELNMDTSYETVVYNGKIRREFSIISPIIKADKVISISKLKTHTMTSYTGAVKNLFGTIPGLYKAQYHFERPQKDTFCSMLVDLCQYVNPCLSIMDGIVAMEGNGPTSGTPRKVGAIIASASPYELDVVASHIVHFKEEEILTITECMARGLTPHYEAIELLGDDPNMFLVKDFKRAQGGDISFLKRIHLPDGLTRHINKMATAKPVFDKKMCVGCGECARCCPPKAITLVNHYPQVDFEKCIKCFCCQELCPKHAVSAKRNFLFDKLFHI